VAISYLSLGELGYFDKKKEKDKKEEVRNEESTEEGLIYSAEEGQKIIHLFTPDPECSLYRAS
jgi:hypothetical protein